MEAENSFISILRTEEILGGVGLETTRRWERRTVIAAGVARAPLAGWIQYSLEMMCKRSASF